MDAFIIQKMLKVRYSDRRQWIFFEECPTGTGAVENYLDGFAISAYPSSGYKRIAFEIKTSRQDFIKEIKTPTKRRNALIFSNEFYFVAPMGLIKREELPIECGLMEVDEEIRITVSAPFRESIRPTWGFLAALVRRQSQRIDVLEKPR